MTEATGGAAGLPFLFLWSSCSSNNIVHAQLDAKRERLLFGRVLVGRGRVGPVLFMAVWPRFCPHRKAFYHVYLYACLLRTGVYAGIPLCRFFGGGIAHGDRE